MVVHKRTSIPSTPRSLEQRKWQATVAADFLKTENKDYYECFYAKSLRDQSKVFSDHIEQIYLNLGLMSAPSQKDYEVIVPCDNITHFCQKPNFFAHMNDKTKTMNLCDAWFDNSIIAATAGRRYRLSIVIPNFHIIERAQLTRTVTYEHKLICHIN